MKVILLKDVKKVGKAGETVDVSAGYATNFLIAKKLAVVETATSRKVLEEQKAEDQKHQAELKQQAEKLKEEIEKQVLTFSVKAGNGGRVFNSVSTKQIVSALNKIGFNVDKRKFLDHNPIQALGYTNVRIELYKDVICTIKVHLVEA